MNLTQIKNKLTFLDFREKKYMLDGSNINSVVKANSNFRFYWQDDESFEHYTKPYQEVCNLRFKGDIVYKFNSLMDFRAFWDIMCGLEFYKYSYNYNYNPDLKTQEDLDYLKEIENIKEIKDKELAFITDQLLTGKYPPMIFFDPNNSKEVVNIFLTPFDENIINFISFVFNDFNETDTPHEIKEKLILSFVQFMEENRNKTTYNINIALFYIYMQERSYKYFKAKNLYQRQIELTNIELTYFFYNQKNLVELIYCLKKTQKAFFKNEVLTINPLHEEIMDKYRPLYKKVLNFYFKSLIEKLSELIYYLPN
jgi:hypothetical protein